MKKGLVWLWNSPTFTSWGNLAVQSLRLLLVVPLIFSSLFDVIEQNDGYFYYEDEMVPLLRCPRYSAGSVHVTHSHEIAEKTKYKNDLKFGEGYSECNVGIVGIKSVNFEKWITEWKSLMWDCDLNWLFTADPLLFWHEQDFFRLQRDINDKDVVKFGKNLVYHAVGAMGYEIEEVGDFEIPN